MKEGNSDAGSNCQLQGKRANNARFWLLLLWGGIFFFFLDVLVNFENTLPTKFTVKYFFLQTLSNAYSCTETPNILSAWVRKVSSHREAYESAVKKSKNVARSHGSDAKVLAC